MLFLNQQFIIWGAIVVCDSYNITTYIRTNKKKTKGKRKKKNNTKKKLNRKWAERITLLSNAFMKREGIWIKFKERPINNSM